MQLCNLSLRLAGSMLHVIPVTDATPAEILILKRIHGEDAVIDIRPTKMDKRQQAAEWERLSTKYDRASAFKSAPGEERVPMMEGMFPGAVRKLPVALKEIGLGHLMSPASIAAAERAAAAAAPTPDDDDAAGDETVVFDPDAPPEEEG